MAEKCQVCGGKVVNGRCSLCGMPYRNDDVLYHLNEPREVHYKHASAKVREMMRGYGSADGNASRKSGNTGWNVGRAAGSQNRSAAGSAGNRQNPGNAGRGFGAGGQGSRQEQRQRPAAKNTAMKQTGTLNQGRAVNQRGITNQRGTLNQGKTQPARDGKSGKSRGKGWIIWLIIGLLCAIPGLLDTIMDWISMNL